MRTTADVAMEDQASAARADAERLMAGLSRQLGLTDSWAEPGPWLTDLVASTIGTSARSVRACPHVLARRGPGLTFLLAHRRRLSCAPCTVRWATAAVGTAEDRTCDVCRTVLGPGQVYAVQVRVGAVLVAVGHCAGCRPAVRGPELTA